MSDIVSTYRRAFLYGVSRQNADVSALTAGDYDIAVFTSSWDARAVAVTRSNQLRTALSILLLFDVRDSGGLRDKHDAALASYLETCSERVEIVTGCSTEVLTVWRKISQIMLKFRSTAGRPLRVFMDLSACPRYYSLAVAAAAFVHRLGRTVTYFYSEANYEDGIADGELAFTGGRWATVAIPSLSGLFDPSKKSFYLVSAGFEGERIYRAVSRADPDRVALLFAKPGFCPAYEARAAEANRSLIKEFCVSPAEIITAPAADAIGCWRIVEKSMGRDESLENSFFMCCGTKPHALALGLSAIASGKQAVLYNIPEEHRVHRTTPSGTYWSYNLVDASAIG